MVKVSKSNPKIKLQIRESLGKLKPNSSNNKMVGMNIPDKSKLIIHIWWILYGNLYF